MNQISNSVAIVKEIKTFLGTFSQSNQIIKMHLNLPLLKSRFYIQVIYY